MAIIIEIYWVTFLLQDLDALDSTFEWPKLTLIYDRRRCSSR
jgi:hypothetical protein